LESPPDAERRQLTVMFCDLVGSTVLSEQLDPEELRELIWSYQQAAAEVIDRFQGHIAQYLGDGLLVYFGYPQAHENDAQRAVLAGLGILTEIERLNTALQQRPQPRLPLRLSLRLGLHTGLVVVGQVGSAGRREQLALGETTNIAARLQEIAKPGTLVISAVTYRLIEGFFTCRSLGLHTLKGISRPLETYEVLRPRQVYNRLSAVPAGLTPLVGREQEIASLLSRWQQAAASHGQVVLLSGEAGLGKSRLVQTLKERLVGAPHLWLDCHGSPYYQNSRLYPILDLLQRLLRFKRKDSPEQKFAKLETALQQYGLPLPQTVPLFAPLLSLPLPDSYAPLNLTPQRQKQKTAEAFLVILLKLTAIRPVLIVVEDLHWVDPSTLELLDSLVERVTNLPVLVLFTFRPDFTPYWPGRPHLTHLTLTRLPRPQVEHLLKYLTRGKTLPPELRHHILAKTDGIPIFVEELTKMILELDLLQETLNAYELTGPLPDLAIPATLHDSLMARLDRLGPAREIAQLGAVLGREFSYQLLQAITPFDQAALQNHLAQLVEAELLYQAGLPPQAGYTFKHALIQEAAYRSLLRRKRRQVHQQIAHILTEQFPEIGQAEPELLAHHYTAAGLPQQAIRYWQQAGRRALEYSANLEAIHHFTQALELLQTLPETPQRIEQELQARVALGAPLLMTSGYAAPEVETNYDQARALCKRLPEMPQLPSILFGLWVFYLARTQLDAALELGQQLMDLAHQLQNPALWLEAHQVQGINLFNLGRLPLARAHLEQAVALYDPRQPEVQSLAANIGADRGVVCLCHLALTLWLLGYPEQALARSREAVALAEALTHPYSLVFAACWAAWLHHYRAEPHLLRQHTEPAMVISREQGFTLLAPLVTMLDGWALTQLGQAEAGLSQVLQGMADYRTTGAQVGYLQLSALLAEAYGKVGQVEAGLVILTELLPLVPEKGERFCEAELHRLKGNLLLQLAQTTPQPNLTTEAEASFHRAIEIARYHQTRSLELRATLSLSRLYRQQGCLSEVRPSLETLYNHFTEGFETVDLKEAKLLLDTIS
jgi:predicted ATPase/class 3 adenylate cyclase